MISYIVVMATGFILGLVAYATLAPHVKAYLAVRGLVALVAARSFYFGPNPARVHGLQPTLQFRTSRGVVFYTLSNAANPFGFASGAVENCMWAVSAIDAKVQERSDLSLAHAGHTRSDCPVCTLVLA